MPSSVEKESIPPLRFAPLVPEVWDKLCLLQRTGWVERGVKNPETVGEHILALRTLAFSLRNELRVDMEKLLALLEVHDFPEAIVGDEVIISEMPEVEKVMRTSKFEREQTAMKTICEPLWVRLSLFPRSTYALDNEAPHVSDTCHEYEAHEAAYDDGAEGD